MFRSLRYGFITGLVLLLPLAATIFVIRLLTQRIGQPIADTLFFFVDNDIRNLPGIGFALELAGLILIVLCITALGFFSQYVLGRMVVNWSERIITAVPFVNAVYRTVKQIVDTFSKQQKAVFQKVVLTEYPRKGVYVLGFLTSDAKGEVQEKTGKSVANVFVPTTPNPTSGFLLMVPKDEIIEMEMSVGDGMKLIVSGGAVSPPWPKPEGKPKTVELENPALADG